jgi:hypothetical protein
MITPAAGRLYEWLQEKDLALDQSTCQEIIDVVFNLPPGADGEELTDRVAAALQATLTMMNGNQEQWTKMARQIVVRAGLDAERNGSN